MIDDFEIDQDGFNSEIEENKKSIAEKNLSYEMLLDFAARMTTERDYAEGLYKMEKVENDWQRGILMSSLTREEAADHAKQAFAIGKNKQKTETGKHAVSHREDQLLKSDWINHCSHVLSSGKNIRTLDDLLNTSGYPPAIAKILPRTLKTWAKEAGIVFYGGRPRKT